MLYTTTVPWPGPNLPVGVIPADSRHAAALDQKPFTIDARTAAVLPITAERRRASPISASDLGRR